MKKQLNIFTKMHRSTNRDYLGRMFNNKVISMTKAKNSNLIIGMDIGIMVTVDINIFLENGLQ